MDVLVLLLILTFGRVGAHQFDKDRCGPGPLRIAGLTVSLVPSAQLHGWQSQEPHLL
jgi:hypothetical protein